MAEAAQTPVQKYLGIISAYETEFKKWLPRVEKILKRYRDDNRSASGNQDAKFNILWANVETLVPAVYARMPKADVSRRFSDNDPVGRVASLLLERALDFEIEHYTDFRSAMHNCVKDRFLGGRGSSWVRYDPHVVAQQKESEEAPEITDVVPDPMDQTAGEDPEPAEQIEYECSPTDYVYWKDFGHTSARTWEEVSQVWRWVYMTKDALTARFGKKIADSLPLDTGPESLQRAVRGDRLSNNCAKICELWDKETGKAYWFSKNTTEFLDERDDPLDLEEFFPCPKPLYATTTTDNLIPVPDFVLYQDQANELDILSDRIDGFVKALRVRGVYDASQPALQRLLTEGDNNTLIGVDKWQAFSEKGGLKGTIDLLPLNDIAAALQMAYQAREDIKGQVYEITGISDIIRGETAASETATAQQIKGQYAGLRLKSMQETVAIFASELLRIKAQIICGKYQDQTILSYAAAQQLSPADQQMIPQALQLLRQSPLRSFHVEVSADSLVQIDEDQLKQDRLNFLNTVSNFMREAVPAGQQVPEMVPAIVAMLQFGIAAFPQAKTIEGTLDSALQKMQQNAVQQAQNPKPSPEQQKAQAEAQASAQQEQIRGQVASQVEQIKSQSAAQVEQMRAQMDMASQRQQQAHEQQMKLMDLQMEQRFDAWKALLDSKTRVEVANITATAQTDVAAQASLDKQYALDNAPAPQAAPSQ